MAYLVMQGRGRSAFAWLSGRDEDKSWGLIVKRGMTLTVIGVVIGVSALLFAVALAACLIPARRAASIDPTQALRAE
jgi:hypothetical protein